MVGCMHDGGLCMTGCMHGRVCVCGGGACMALETATEAGGMHPIKCILVLAKLSPV